MSKEKPWLSPAEQVEQMKTKGVKFQIEDESFARNYLANNNTYFRIRSYRTNFARHDSGPEKGKFVNLDFAMLVDLAIIDMRLRDEMLKLTLDIEHFSKVSLLQEIERRGEDGYAIVADFMEQQAKNGHPVQRDLTQGKESAYIGSLIKARPKKDYPVWEFVEIIPFGRFVHFLFFCANRFNDGRLRNRFYMLLCVKNLRNGCAHNSCVLNDMRGGSAAGSVNRDVTRALGQIGIGREARRTKLSNERLRQIATTVYLHQSLCSSSMVSLRAKGLLSFAQRVQKHQDYYDESCPANSALKFISVMISAWYGKC